MAFSSNASPPGTLISVRRFVQIDLITFRFFCLIAALAIYALFGSPTPDRPGLAEIITGALLMFAAGGAALRSAFIPDLNAPLWRGAGSLALVYGLTIMVLLSVMQGNDPRLIARDVIPFLFLLLPLFTADIFTNRPDYFKKLLAAFVCAGLLFSFRGLMQARSLSFLTDTDELYYLANSPSVLFAALWLIGESGRGFVRKPGWRALAILGIVAALALLPLFVMSWALQRAGLGAAAFYILILAALGLWRYPYRAAFLILAAAALSLPFWSGVMENFHELSQKTVLYGFNMRGEEMAAVVRELSASPFSMLLGVGWGGTFESPAVAGIRVNYTHSLLSAMLLKTGALGLALTTLYLCGLARVLMSRLSQKPVLAFALAAPFLIDVFLYASYKSLDFGFLLLLIAAL